MASKVKEFSLLLATVCLLALAVHQTGASQRRRLFDFQHFMEAFKKHYANDLELLHRRAIFWARSMRVFVTGLKYKLGQLDFYLAINPMSDRTLAEVRRTHLHRPARRPSNPSMSDDSSVEIELAKLDPDLLELAASASRQDPSVGELLEEAPVPLPRRIVRQSEVHSRPLRLDDLVRDQPDDEIETEPLTKPLPRNNKPPPENPMSRFFQNLADSVARNLVQVDHRHSGCLLAPRGQGPCGSCYLFAMMALYEWHYCNETGARVAFSEQYGLDCGRLNDMEGCEGAELQKVVEFTKRYGLELRTHYPYAGQVGECPYGEQMPELQPHRMGYLRADNIDWRHVELRDFEQALRRSPLVVTVATTRYFHEFGGGVDRARGCNEEEAHAMLLVGHGKEDGHAYWLFRNSYGVKFGQAGHYKLNKHSRNCILDDVGWTLVGSFAADGAHNEHYAHRHMRRHYQARLAAHKRPQEPN